MEQALIICIPLSDSGFGLAWEREIISGLGNDLSEAVSESEVGEFDGHDVGEGVHTMYLYGPDVDALFQLVRPLLTARSWPAQITVIKRFGPPGAQEIRIQLEGRA